MKNEIFRFAGLNSAILAALMLVVSPLQLHAQPSSIPNEDFTKERTLECRPPNAMNPVAAAQMKDFWQQAWGRDLIVGEEGMLLQETQATGVWEILVGNKSEERYVGRGTFIEEARYSIDLGAELVDRIYKEQAKATYLERYIMAGIVVGSTGTSIAVTAVVTDLGNDEGNIARSFSILQSGADSGESANFAKSTVARLNVTADFSADDGGAEKITQDGSDFEKSGSVCTMLCNEEHISRVTTCNSTKDACNADAYSVAGLCALACITVAGPFLAVCLGLCDLTLISKLSTCAIAAQACLNASVSQKQSCVAGCVCPTFFCDI